jgi:hypothetical protein
VVSAYRPCHSLGVGSTYQQHLRFLARVNRGSECPRQAILDDLKKEILRWSELGNSVIVMSPRLVSFFSDLYMQETILERHSSLSPPATHNRNDNRVPIDGIWASQGIRISAGGYLAFGAGAPSDHRALWIDVPDMDFLGYDMPAYVPTPAQRLHSRDPRIANRYLSLLKTSFQANNIVPRLHSDELETAYNVLHSDQQALKLAAEGKSRKLCVGGVLWSPKLQVFRDTIEFWTTLLRKRRGVKVSMNRLRRLLRQLVIDGDPFSLSTAELVSRTDASFSAYKEAKRRATNWQDDFLHELAESRAKKYGTTVENELRQLRIVASQRRTSRNIKRMRQRLGQQSTNQVYITTNGVRRVVIEQ